MKGEHHFKVYYINGILLSVSHSDVLFNTNDDSSGVYGFRDSGPNAVSDILGKIEKCIGMKSSSVESIGAHMVLSMYNNMSDYIILLTIVRTIESIQASQASTKFV